MARRAFIIGGTGQIGLAIAERPLSDGWDVTAAHRRSRFPNAGLAARGMRTVVLDRDDTENLRHALADGADAVVDVVAYNAGHAEHPVTGNRHWLLGRHLVVQCLSGCRRAYT